ncbi:MAG: hypothetical protein R6W82_08255, partial [bacterium]
MQTYEKLSDPVALTIFLITLSLPVLIGLWAMFRTRNQSDFLIGGRAMDRVVVALSAVSSGRSSWLVLGVSGMAYTRGVGAVWAVVGYILAELFQFLYIGGTRLSKSRDLGKDLISELKRVLSEANEQYREAGDSGGIPELT